MYGADNNKTHQNSQFLPTCSKTKLDVLSKGPSSPHYVHTCCEFGNRQWRRQRKAKACITKVYLLEKELRFRLYNIEVATVNEFTQYITTTVN